MNKDEANEKLRADLQQHAEAVGIAPEGHLLNDIAVICSWAPMENNGRTVYTAHYAADEIPTHVAVGLHQTAIHLTLNETPEED